MTQIHITKIANGYLVMTPPKKQQVTFANAQVQQQEQPDTNFCSDMEEVCEFLKANCS